VVSLTLTLAMLLLVPALSPFGSKQARAQEPKPSGAGEAKAKASQEAESGSQPKPEAKPAPKPKVAVFRLAGPVSEVPEEVVFAMGGAAPESLKSLVGRLNKAAKDPEVKAVVLLLDRAEFGTAQGEEIRQALARIRTAGKDVLAHADSVNSLKAYALLAGASRLSVVPTADIAITGLFGESPYLRGLLDKVGVQPDFMTCGKFKSAAEIFMRYGPSQEADQMQNWLLDSLFESLVSQIAEGRKVSPETVRNWIDGGLYVAEKARELKIVDAVEPRQALTEQLRSQFGEDLVFDHKYGKKAEPKPDFSSPFGLFKFWGELLGAAGGAEKAKARPAVGIVYVRGPIVLGSGDASLFAESSATASTIRRALDEASRDDSVKAVVLRVDSPGGSAVASEIILDASRRVKAKKPLVVSMGDVAGSGGYYVACGADTIFADETTITGSIGVVSGKLATTGLFDKLGVRFKPYRRGKNAGMLASNEAFTADERARMRELMDEIYDVFKGHVQQIRGDRLKKPLEELAGGRVYTGKQALELGLVDKIGTLDDAVRHVADLAKLAEDRYDVRVVPKPKTFLERLIEESSEDTNTKGLELGMEPPIAAEFADLATIGRPGSTLLELLLPALKALDPTRATLVRTAIGRLELLRREGVVVMMPELGLAP
jgi:protease-4